MSTAAYVGRIIVHIRYLGNAAQCLLECGHIRTLQSPAYPGLMVACTHCPIP